MSFELSTDSETWQHKAVKKWVIFIKVVIKDLLLILFSLNMTDNLFVSKSLITPCILFIDNKRNVIKTFIDTNTTKYAFIDKITVHIICENLEISFISLSKLKLIKDFDRYLMK